MHDNRTSGKFEMPMLRFARASLVGTFLTLSPKKYSLSALPLLAAVLAMALLFAAMANSVPAEAQSLTDYDADNDGLIEVSSLAQLDAIRYDLDGDGSPTNSTDYEAAFPNAQSGMGCPSTGCTGYELTADIDFDTNGDGRTDIAGDAYWNGGAGWQPIGQEINDFGATFDGNNQTIANLYITRDLSGVGLFGYTSTQSDIKRIGLVGVKVAGSWNTGGLVGVNRSAITDSYVSGREASVTGVYNVGGLAGYSADTGTIAGSYATVDVNGEGGVGGLVGQNGGPISASYATGNVTGIGSGQVWGVGGLVGDWQGPDVAQPISASFATGDVTGYGDVGGLIGNMGQPIVNSYAAGDVTGETNVGGLVGSAYQLSITSSFSTGSVIGSSDGGGLLGLNFVYRTQITASYWDTQTSGLSTSAGGEGKTTSELQSPTSNTGIYATWDSNAWDFGTSSEYPTLIGVGTASPIEMDRSALVALYNATDGDNWTNNTNWLSDEPLGDWHGVTTDAGGRVTGLSLGRNVLTGAIPSQLGSLSNLETLWVGDNQLTGEIPAELGSLSNLDYLGLESNAFTGAIPTELGNLSSVTWLALNGNQLTGALPQSFTSLSALNDFAFSENSGLCAPTDAAFQAWLQGISNSNMSTEVAVPFGPNCDDSQPTPTTDSCVEPLTDDGAINDSWADNCDSENKSGSYARYYTFTLTEQSDVSITLESSEDTYLFLLDGHGRNGAERAQNDDHSAETDCAANLASSTDSCIMETLPAGDYTVEATTYSAGVTGNFTLSVSGLAASVVTPEPTTTITFGDLNWHSAMLQNRIAQYIAEMGYGYSTSVEFSATLPLFNALRTGEIDVLMEVWLPSQEDSWEEALAESSVSSPGTSLGTDWQSAFVIPKYLQEQYPELDSVEDLKEERFKALFATNETRGKARLVSCVIGWACETVNFKQIEGYGLADHVDIVNPGDGATLNADITQAYEKREPWLGYQWGTNDAALLLDVVRLEEPPYSDECWATTMACAYEDATILIAVNAGLPNSAADFVDALTEWDFNVEEVYGPVVRWQANNPDANLEDAAMWWLRGNSELWSDWVTEDAATAIEDALDNDEIPAGWPNTPNIIPEPPTTDTCVQPLPDDHTAIGHWASDCPSTSRSGSYASYYTFTLGESAEVTITLESDEDTYLFLLEGVGKDGAQVADNDDHASESDCTAALGNSTDSCITESLDAGDYTIEATIYDTGVTGDFTLTVTGLDGGTVAPPPAPNTPSVVVSAGSNHACALDSNGEIACQGVNESNQVSGRPTSSGYIALSVGGNHSCAIDSSGIVECWGADDSRQVSDRPTSSGFVAVSVGDKHSCAIDTNGSVECWGSNEHGQSSAPPNGTFLAIGAGDNYTCALRSDNSLECWGRFEAVDSGAPTPPPPPPTTPGPTPAPDLAVDAPTVSGNSPTAGASFTLNATVRNRGDGAAASTTLRYFQSTDSTITTSDTEVGMASVNGLSASGSSSETISLTAPSTAGTYYYGACVDAVSGESDTGNNCSTAVAVTVGAAAQPTDGPFTIAVTTCSGTRDSSGVDVEMGGTVTATRDVSVTSLTVTGTANGLSVGTVSMKNGRWQAGEIQNWSMSGTVSTSSSTVSCEATLQGFIQSGSGTSISSSKSAATEQKIAD